MRKNSLLKTKTILYMTLGSILLSIGIYFFKFPNNFVTGGVAGIGVLLSNVTPITAGQWISILNIVLLLLGFLFLGNGVGIKTVYCSLFYSALTTAFEHFLPLSSPLTNQPCLELMYAMILTAIGSAIIFYAGGSSGGTDIVALILKKYTKMNVGKALLVTDFAVAVSSFIMFDIQIGLFSLAGLFIKAFVVDGIIESLNVNKYFIVITKNKDSIAQYIMDELHHGVTTHKAVGEYTGDEQYMLHTVCKRIEAIKLKSKINLIDSNAFVIVATGNEIIGRGFREV